MHAAQIGTLVAQKRRYTFAEPVSDDAFMAFAAQFPELQAERDGYYSFVLLSPQANAIEKLNAELIRLVENWNATLPERGAAYGSSTLATWLDGSLKGPDCAWCSAGRDRKLEAAEKTFGDIIADIVFELRSKSDTWTATTGKCGQWNALSAAPPHALLVIAREVAGSFEPSGEPAVTHHD